ncbi:MAG: biotin--[acetyl-CoA-carboxylase] ligase [Bacteroidaceae bacterium]|nr:biotin--[acetyl-CoA-carboxylase] ligase [Bacteroidaceae bacterium]MBP9637169.1 biotin--[acetyl-CoA-carboxylase] ligase [Bacteroidaceae bacterium]
MSCPIEPTDFIRIQLRETDSTINALSELLKESNQFMPASKEGLSLNIPEFFTLTAQYQFSGRGQRGNTWESEAGKNLLFSTLVYPIFLKIEEQFVLSEIISLAIKDTLDKIAPQEEFSIKWPNDIYWKEKKIAGILIENDLESYEDKETHQRISRISNSIFGVGLNVNQSIFTSNAPNPYSLLQITGREFSTDQILSKIITRLRYYYKELQKDEKAILEIRKAYHQALFRHNGLHLYKEADSSEEFLAEIVKVEPSGRLILRRKDGIEKGYFFKEVQHVL